MQFSKSKSILPLCAVLVICSSIAMAGGNRELMEQKKLKTLLLNEAVIEQIDGLEDDTLVSFIGRVVKRKDGSIEILVEQLELEKKPVSTKVVKKASQRYIQYMSFEEMQKLPKSPNDNKASNFYGGGGAIQ